MNELKEDYSGNNVNPVIYNKYSWYFIEQDSYNINSYLYRIDATVCHLKLFN